MLKSDFLIIRNKRRRKTLTIELSSDAKFLVKVPFNYPEKAIWNFISDNLEKLEKSREKFLANVQVINLRKGEYLYLGQVKKINNKLDQNLLNDWYKKQARQYFYKELLFWSKKMNLEFKRLRLMQARSRWGSCNYNKKYINLNWHLIKLRPELIKYVIIHELAHLRYPNHSADFWALVGSYIPNYEELRKELKSFSYLTI